MKVETEPAAIVIRFDLDVDGHAAQELMRQLQPLLPDDADAWIGIAEYAAAVDALLTEFGQPARRDQAGTEEKKLAERCKGTLGERPYWMGVDQYDPCRCKLLAGHDGPHACEHENAELLPVADMNGDNNNDN